MDRLLLLRWKWGRVAAAALAGVLSWLATLSPPVQWGTSGFAKEPPGIPRGQWSAWSGPGTVPRPPSCCGQPRRVFPSSRSSSRTLRPHTRLAMASMWPSTFAGPLADAVPGDPTLTKNGDYRVDAAFQVEALLFVFVVLVIVLLVLWPLERPALISGASTARRVRTARRGYMAAPLLTCGIVLGVAISVPYLSAYSSMVDALSDLLVLR